MKVLIAGGTGFLGTHLIPRLREAGHEITATARLNRTAVLEAAGCQPLVLDLVAKGPLPAVVTHDAAVFLAQSPDYQRWPESAPQVMDVNVSGLVRFGELARQAGVHRFFYASSGSIYGPRFEPLREEFTPQPGDFYALSKKMGEEALAFYERFFGIVILRLFTIYGPKQKARVVPTIIDRVVSGDPVMLQMRHRGEDHPSGLVTTPCYVEDAAKAIEALLATDFRGTLNVAGSEEVSIRQVAERAGKLLGKSPVFHLNPEPRKGDFVADNFRLCSLVRMAFTPLSTGLESVIRSDYPAPARV